MVKRMAPIKADFCPNKKPFPKIPLSKSSSNCDRARERFQKELSILKRLSDLFSKPKPAYVLNGSAALHFIFLGKRIPSDIDLRCDDVEATRKALSNRFEEVPRSTTVPVYGFLDENGVLIDLSQNQFLRTRKTFVANPTSPNLFKDHSTPVFSYDFEVLFAEKLIALTRKRDLKDLFDAHSCLSRPVDLARVMLNLKEIAGVDGIDLLTLASPSYVLDGGLGGVVPASQTTPEEMLAKVQSFVRSLI